MSNPKYKFAVIGNGLIGSAAGKYLSELSGSVVIIGPREDDSTAVFSSHYDQGRLCRVTSQDPIWQVINGAAVHKYSTLEQKSKISFHCPVGELSAVPRSPAERQTFLDWIEQVQQQVPNVKFQYFPAGDLSWKESLFPMLDFSPDCDVFYEAAPSGVINPRQLIGAQNAIAQQNGAKVLRELVTKVASSSEGVCLTLSNGESIFADKALIASGAFTNFNNLLPEPIPLRYKTETTVWGTVSEETANNLKDMPAVCYDIQAKEGKTPDVDDLYMAPPLLYPDGTFKIKMGGNTILESWPSTLEEIQEWFLHGNSDADLPAMVKALQAQLPKVEFVDFTSHRCIVT